MKCPLPGTGMSCGSRAGVEQLSKVPALTTGERIRLLREAKGLTRPVLSGLVGRKSDWLKNIENGRRRLNSLPMLVRLARALDVKDLSELTGDDTPASISAWDIEVHHAVPAIRDAMRDVSFLSTIPTIEPPIPPEDLQQRVHRLWLLWHSSPQQRTDVGTALPALIRQAHASIRAHHGVERRRAQAATGDLYRLVQRLLAHICEPELHALAVERGRAMSENADTPLSLALAAWSSSVSLCASGHFDDAARLADAGAELLAPLLDQKPGVEVVGTLGSLYLEAAAAHGLAGREGDAFRYLDAAELTAKRLPRGTWHRQSGFEQTNVEIFGIIVNGCLHRTGEAIAHAGKLAPSSVPSVVRRSRLLLEVAQAHANRREPADAVRYLTSATDVSTEAVGLIPWARELAVELADAVPGTQRQEATKLAARLKAVH
ncbi:MAG: helix-turn-helix domain-containing protein [Actinobacteria bacterium]|nr:helix-turn-helix domain-containing protein [Actinomycetota bacterium]